MENSSNIPKFPNTNARLALAKRLNLPYHDNKQDWEYEVAVMGELCSPKNMMS